MERSEIRDLAMNPDCASLHRGYATQKPAPRRRSFSSTCFERLQILVRCAGGLVGRILDGVLGVTHRLLALAFDFLDGAFALQPVGTGGFADALLGFAHGLIGRAFDLVCRASHLELSSLG